MELGAHDISVSLFAFSVKTNDETIAALFLWCYDLLKAVQHNVLSLLEEGEPLRSSFPLNECLLLRFASAWPSFFILHTPLPASSFEFPYIVSFGV